MMGFTAIGNVDLHGARIGGAFDCDGRTRPHQSRRDRAGRLFAKRRGQTRSAAMFTAIGLVYSRAAHIVGQLSCNDGKFTNGNRTALDADALKVDGSVLCGGEFTATGAVYLRNARIGGQLEL